jgi:hypothetical protein
LSHQKKRTSFFYEGIFPVGDTAQNSKVSLSVVSASDE